MGITAYIYRHGDLEVDFQNHRVYVKQEEVILTGLEYRLLSYLAGNADKVLNQTQIMDNVWGENFVGFDHILQVSISRLNKKIGKGHIVNRYGLGYMMLREERTDLTVIDYRKILEQIVSIAQEVLY